MLVAPAFHPRHDDEQCRPDSPDLPALWNSVTIGEGAEVGRRDTDLAACVFVALDRPNNRICADRAWNVPRSPQCFSLCHKYNGWKNVEDNLRSYKISIYSSNFRKGKDGEGGIRTLGTRRYTRFPVVPDRPDSGTSPINMPERGNVFSICMLLEDMFPYPQGHVCGRFTTSPVLPQGRDVLLNGPSVPA